MLKDTSAVFGISNSILNDSYVDRDNLDEEIKRYLSRPTHIALRGESKCGKSWLRKKNIKNAIVVQCRFGKKVVDIYIDALSQLGIKFTVEESDSCNIKGKVEAETSIGQNILMKLGLKTSIEGSKNSALRSKSIGKDINNLRFIADILINSKRKLVIEDFHYLSIDERKNFSYDLKTFWDYGCFMIIIGVWSQSNMLSYLNSDLTGRIVEKSIYWSNDDLKRVIDNGSRALKIKFSSEIIQALIDNCFGNVGILQKLILLTLDNANIYKEQKVTCLINKVDYFEKAAHDYANQLNSFYLQFAARVSKGIRNRKDSTGIYAYAMSAIVEADDSKLINGLELDEIYKIAHSRQPRIQKGNLGTILQKLEELQVDKDGRNLVIAFDKSNNKITAVDRQLLFYRKYLQVDWPWEKLIEENVKNKI